MSRTRVIIVLVFFNIASCVGLFLAAPSLAPYSKKLARELGLKKQKPKPKPAEELLPPLPEKFFPTDTTSLSTLFNGIKLKNHIKTEEGDIASRERERDESYLLDLQLNVQVPSPNTTLFDLREVSPKIDEVIPQLEALLHSAEVSPFYYSLYDRKVNNLEYHLDNFIRIPTRHNFFDCETVLELESKLTGRKALLIQSEMDVVTDGTDGDRSDDWDQTSRYFQPFTAYSWAKRSKNLHPLHQIYQDEINQIAADLKQKTFSSDEKKRLAAKAKKMRSWVKNLKYRSSLVASIDPFIVVPTYWSAYKKNAYAPQVGDYAVVIYDSQVYPAIVGDLGPNTKIGEASLLICQTINPQSSGATRAVSDLTVTYLVFPKSRNTPFGPPNLASWKENCKRLINEMGGVSVPLYDWSSHLAALNGERDEVEVLGSDRNLAEEPKASSQKSAPEKMHIVQRGDSLWKIAQEYGVSLENLKKANELSSDLIREGQVLDIPKD